MKRTLQYPLGLTVSGEYDLTHFIYPESGMLTEVSNTLFQPEDLFHSVYIHGVAGTGKSHLLKGLTRKALELNRPIIDLSSRHRIDPKLIASDLPKRALVICDDVYMGVRIPGWEDRFWSLYLKVESMSGRLLVSSRQPPAGSLNRADLSSRMAGQLVVALNYLSDPDLRDMLLGKARLRGLRIERRVLNYIFDHAGRHTNHLDRLLRRADIICQTTRTSKLTIAIVKEALKRCPEIDSGSTSDRFV